GLDAIEIVLQQNEFRRYCRVGLQLENPVAVRVLQSQQRLAGACDRLVEPGYTTVADKRRRFSGRHSIIHGKKRYWMCSSGKPISALKHRSLDRRSGAASCWRASTCRAAEKPERIAPSIVAGKPVST